MAKVLGGALRSDERWHPASQLHALREDSRFAPLEISTLKPLLSNGLSRGAMLQINGLRSSGRTSICMQVLAEATARGEVCAVVDLHDSFHPKSAARAGIRLEQLVWIRCRGNAEHAMRAADLLLHAGGFGVVLLDLCEANARVLNRIPLSYWYRFSRAIEHTPTILLLCVDSPQATSCFHSHLQIKRHVFHWSGKRPFLTLRGIRTRANARRARAAWREPVYLQMVG